MDHQGSQGRVTTGPTYELPALPYRLLGLQYTNWTAADMRLVLAHYGVSTPPDMDKFLLAHELRNLTAQLGLTPANRQAILSAARAESPLPAGIITRRHNRPETGQRRQQQQARTRVGAANILFPNLPRARQTLDAGPVRTDTAEDLTPPTASSSDPPRCMGDDVPLTTENTPTRPITEGCTHQHQFCLDCVAKFIKAQVHIKRADEIMCPSCPQFLEYWDIQAFADPATFEKYEEGLLKQYLNSLDDFRRCQQPDCRSGQICDAPKDNHMDCLACNGKTCLRCDKPGHAGAPCFAANQQELEDPAMARKAQIIADEEYTAAINSGPNCNGGYLWKSSEFSWGDDGDDGDDGGETLAPGKLSEEQLEFLREHAEDDDDDEDW
ncbi:MAG: hypothetical protein Q9191_001171 [Dirinaria sp. TL-2023a]